MSLPRVFVAALVLSLAATPLVAAPAAKAPPASPAAPAAAAPPAEPPPPVVLAPEAEAIRQALETAAFADKATRTAINAFYSGRSFAPAWTGRDGLTRAAEAAIARIGAAADDGLDPTAYALPGDPAGSDLAARAAADVALSQAVVAYARHAWGGRVGPARVSDNFDYDIVLPEPADIVAAVAEADDPAATLSAFNPPQKEFAALRAKLAELRKAGPVEKPAPVPAGGLIKPGESDPRVVLIRKRLGVPADVAAPEVYDEAVVAAVKDLQKSVRLSPDGIVGGNTVAAMNRTGPDHEAIVLANMERWRWMPRDLGDFYVRVNVPDFTADIYRDDAVVHSTRVVVGKVANQTPIFSDEIDHVVVNPTWNVPASIAVKEMLPQIRAARGNIRGYEVYMQVRGRFRPVNPRFINWNRVDMSKIQIKQPPGERNALGSVKFMFPNKYAVYLHDTPSKALFKQDYRAYSHGCVRVMDPWAFADALLLAEEGWGAARIKKLVGGPERRVDMPKHVPVHITYFTAWVDETGALQVRDDLYGHDKATEKALGLT